MTERPSSGTGTVPDVAIVAGSRSGVGAATVRLMLARGVHVLGIDRAQDLPAIPAGCETRYIHVVADAGDERAWLDALDQVRSRFGADPNAVVFVNSCDGVVGEQNLAAYCSAKGAGLQLMRAVALDHARQGIRSNAVCPGSINTPFFMKHVYAVPDPDAFLRDKTERHPAGRLLQPEDIAAVIDFLAGPASIGMTGAVVPVDGGLTAAYDFYVDQAEKEAPESVRRFSGTRRTLAL